MITEKSVMLMLRIFYLIATEIRKFYSADFRNTDSIYIYISLNMFLSSHCLYHIFVNVVKTSSWFYLIQYYWIFPFGGLPIFCGSTALYTVIGYFVLKPWQYYVGLQSCIACWNPKLICSQFLPLLAQPIAVGGGKVADRLS